MAATPSPFKSLSGRGNLQENIQSTFDTPNSIVKLNRKINLLSSTLTVYHKISLGLVALDKKVDKYVISLYNGVI